MAIGDENFIVAWPTFDERNSFEAMHARSD